MGVVASGRLWQCERRHGPDARGAHAHSRTPTDVKGGCMLAHWCVCNLGRALFVSCESVLRVYEPCPCPCDVFADRDGVRRVSSSSTCVWEHVVALCSLF